MRLTVFVTPHIQKLQRADFTISPIGGNEYVQSYCLSGSSVMAKFQIGTTGSVGEKDNFPELGISSPGRVGYLKTIYVEFAKQGTGIGREAVVAISKFIVEKGCSTMFLLASTHVPKGGRARLDCVGFYERMGFEEIALDDIGCPYMKLSIPPISPLRN